jgi:hypothetical protein
LVVSVCLLADQFCLLFGEVVVFTEPHTREQYVVRRLLRHASEATPAEAATATVHRLRDRADADRGVHQLNS